MNTRKQNVYDSCCCTDDNVVFIVRGFVKGDVTKMSRQNIVTVTITMTIDPTTITTNTTITTITTTTTTVTTTTTTTTTKYNTVFNKIGFKSYLLPDIG